MIRHLNKVVVGLLVTLVAGSVHAQAVLPPVPNPVDHPCFQAPQVRNPAAWRKGLEGFGESLARTRLQVSGYEVLPSKLPGNRGIDLIAVKRNAAGTLTDVRLVEVKTRYDGSKPSLARTTHGPQTSRQWLASRLRDLRSMGEEGRKLALEISRYRKAKGVPIEALCEVHDINLGTGTYTIREPVSLTKREGPFSIESELRRISKEASSPQWREWATRHQEQFERVRQARMANWLSGSSSTRSLAKVSGSQIGILGKVVPHLCQAGRVFLRVAGPIAVAAGAAMEAYDLYVKIRAYQEGKISQRELAKEVARTVGGAAGAAAGAWIGGKIGAIVGGPFAWITGPAGAVVGGITGYIIGSRAAEAITEGWYSALDAAVRQEVEKWLKETPNPFD